MNKAKIRLQTRKLTGCIKHLSCEQCGSNKRLQRHHKTYTVSDYVILCQPCHIALHIAEGTWGKGARQMKDCKVCHTPFMPGRSNRTTCGKRCLSEMGRINAMKRWGNQ